MFTIKICGITRVADALAAAEAGADAIGLNFYPGSPRCIDSAVAREIADRLPASVAKVGVFVNADSESILGLHERLKLDYIQLHGDESPRFLRDLLATRPQLQVIRALRLKDGQWDPAEKFVRDCGEQQVRLAALLIDAFRAGQYGGTGATLPWAQLASRPAVLSGLPLILAGGLTPENVAQAIRGARPAGVDTASGVEEAPGRKCARQIREFVRRAREALEPVPGPVAGGPEVPQAP